ncbi:MAG TPA: PAS domain S-box protein [Candidatus Hydrogenedentes bacterium]|nr:PAS domain S-box protein [Candidatus Hydrogenedentota bacterium]HOS03644.1 PAS domain S-box protein [Candidatus Hydrogenedentota bacterium]
MSMSMRTQTPEDSRLSLVLAVERLALAGRYALYVLAATLFLAGELESSPLRITAITSAILTHNLLVHWVFASRRYEWFLGWTNFIVHFIEISVVVAFTGAANSEVFALYYLFVIGFAAYCAELRKTLAAAALCCLSFALVAAIEHRWHASYVLDVGELAVRLGFFLVGAWLVGMLTERLRRTEESSLFRAQALAASEATLRTILDSAADPIVVFDWSELIVEANDRACEFFGFARKDLLGLRLRRFLFDDGTLPHKAAMVMSRGEYRGEVIVVTKEGEEHTVDFVLRAFIRDGKNYYVALLHDITDQKNLREATRLANLDLERLNRELRQVDELKSRFLVTISQRIRSPLSAALGYLELLLNEELGGVAHDQRRAVQTCRRAVLRIFRFLDEALTLPGMDTQAEMSVSPQNPVDVEMRQEKNKIVE